MKFGELIEHCITCIKTFNPVIKTLDSHADEYIASVSPLILMLTLILVVYSSRIHMRKYS